MDLIELFIEPEDDKSGVTGIATVDSPAIDETYFAFNDQKKLKKVRITLGSQKANSFTPVNGDKQILAGALMIPDLEIYRVDDETGKEYNVTFKPETINQIVRKFQKLGFANSINEMHDSNRIIQGAVLEQHFIINRAMGMNPPLGQDHLPDGTWFGIVYVGDKKVWDEFIKTGIYTGFSVEGNFYERPIVNDLPEEVSQAIVEAIQ